MFVTGESVEMQTVDVQVELEDEIQGEQHTGASSVSLSRHEQRQWWEHQLWQHGKVLQSWHRKLQQGLCSC